MISIIMPVYNASRFLRQAIDSILNQSYKDYEFIIIDDGSTDDSQDIIKSYTDPRIRYCYQSNQGVAATLNNGIALAKGKYIWRHDADDISLPEKLEVELNFLEEHPEFVLCACQVAFMTEVGKVAWRYRQPNNSYWKNKEAFNLVKREDFNPYSPITHGTVLIRTDVMKALGGYRTEFITSEDVDLWLRLIQQFNAAVINQCLSLHRLSRTSVTKIHGWKNEFFRNLAFKFYDQRLNNGKDELELGKPIVLTQYQQKLIPVDEKVKNFRGDILFYVYPMAINARDWSLAFNYAFIGLKDGWKSYSTWNYLLQPLLGRRLVKLIVALKNVMK
jgi:glycosyltransferase involved in cell wall biosynthesis